VRGYFKSLYGRTMEQAYGRAFSEVISAIDEGGAFLDCGASAGAAFERLGERIEIAKDRYHGIEWDEASVAEGRSKGLDIQQGDLNRALPFEDNKFRCIYALSVLEHLLYPCRFLNNCYRTLQADGTLVLLTPNISTYFTAALILAGKMPSSGPHPDSDLLIQTEELFRVRPDSRVVDSESDTPVHRHLVVFSFSVLRNYLRMIGFSDVQGYGFGLYPFPNFMQPVLEKLDPYHCHQMVFIARK
jgi:SAM-dependent methyltransferase